MKKRVTMRIGAAAMVAAWTVVFLLVGCIDTRTMPVEYGAKSDPEAIITALNKPIENMKATDVKVGEFTARETIQDVALGQSISAVGLTGATITEKAEDADRMIFSGVLHQLDLQADGTYSKVSREGQIMCASKTACACGECDSTGGNQSSSTSFIGSKEEQLVPPIEKKTLATKALSGYATPVALIKSMAASSAAEPTLPTYHQFSTWVTRESPPSNVASVPGCLGIPQCLINVYHVNFDEVYWDQPKGQKVHVEATVSPDVPYLSRNLTLCQSLMVNVGKDGSAVLLKQCSNTFDFRFEAE